MVLNRAAFAVPVMLLASGCDAAPERCAGDVLVFLERRFGDPAGR